MIHQIIEDLYVGDDAAFDKAKERSFAIVSACKEGPHGHRSILAYGTKAAPKDDYYLVTRGKHLALNLIDSENPNFIPEQVILPAVEFVAGHRKGGQGVLIHCNQGQSRSPSIALMYLRSIGEMPYSFVRSEYVFRTLYPAYNPGAGIRQFARSHWAALENKYES